MRSRTRNGKASGKPARALGGSSNHAEETQGKGEEPEITEHGND
jgi:hypothetical protein